MKISEASLAKLDPGASGEIWRKDSKLTGYAVRARRLADDSIQRTFFVVHQMRTGGVRKTTKTTIGNWKDPWSEVDARVEAKRLLAMRERGDRMVSGKTQARGERRVSDLVAEFESNHVVKKKRATASEYTRVLHKHILPAFGDMPVTQVTRPDVRDWHQTFAKTPYQANRCLAIVSKMFAYAVQREWRTDNPATRVEKFKEAKRESWLNQKQLPKFLDALNRRAGPHYELLRFLTVSGWRVREAIKLTWDEVDLQHMVVRLRDTKTGKSVRALSSDAAALLDRQQHRIGYVFSGSAGVEPVGYKRVRELLAEVCKEAGITGITCHSLRRTAASFAAVAGSSVLEMMRTFGWKSTQMASHYVEAAEALSRIGAEKAASAINVFRKPAAELKPMRHTK